MNPITKLRAAIVTTVGGKALAAEHNAMFDENDMLRAELAAALDAKRQAEYAHNASDERDREQNAPAEHAALVKAVKAEARANAKGKSFKGF